MAVSGNFTAVHIEDCFTSTYIYTTAGRTGDFTGLVFRAVTNGEVCIAGKPNTVRCDVLSFILKSNAMTVQTQYNTCIAPPITVKNNIIC